MLEAIVLAGGMGTRLREVVPELPKPMAPVAGRPFLEILLESLAKKGFGRVILSVGYMAEVIIEYFGSEYKGMKVYYSIEKELLGTGGAIRSAMDFLTQDHVFVMNGDTYLNANFAEINELWIKCKNPIVVGLAVSDASRYGLIEHDEGYIKSFSEKSKFGPGIINAGCYVLDSDFHKNFDSDKFSFEEWLTNIKCKLTLKLYICEGEFIDIGIPEDYRRAQIFFEAITDNK